MIYVFDTNSFVVLGHYFPGQFPSFWKRLDSAVSQGHILSVHEVYRELDSQSSRPHLRGWLKRNKHIFLHPTEEEGKFVRKIFSVPHFQQLVSEKQRLKGTPVADPFLIASASCRQACVVTEETKKEHSARMPNVCEHFSVDWTSLEGFMEREGWQF